jgi:hypothetical protein
MCETCWTTAFSEMTSDGGVAPALGDQTEDLALVRRQTLDRIVVSARTREQWARRDAMSCETRRAPM